MSTNLTDHKFGLPKPDFQALPKKKALSPILLIIGIVLVLIAAKMSYNFYFKAVKNERSSTEAINNGPATGQAPGITAPSLAQGASPAEAGSNARGAIRQSVGGGHAFNHKKKRKVKKSISATQRALAAKQNKPLVKPGTYQELKEPQGIYHLVVVSCLDKQSAMKAVQQLIKKRLGVYLILPKKGEKYYRVTIGHSKTQYEAERQLERFKSTYNQLFVLEY